MKTAVPRRLITAILPISYELHFDIDMEKFVFAVHETLHFELKRRSRTLVLHASGLKIKSAWANGSTKARSIHLNDDAQTVTLEFADQLETGTHRMEIVAHGAIGENLHGIYRSRFERNGATQWLAVTQFEAVHAREAFVCIDEPLAKATFDVSITAQSEVTVLANTHVLREIQLESGRVRHEFATTPRMSTYLLAFIIGELESVKKVSVDGTLVRIFATPGKRHELVFALETADRSLRFLRSYFDIPYPLKKLDMVAIPDFGAGAMENWGLITYRETALLLDPENSSLPNRQRVAEVIAHELAHQWFGNLVTMAWWSDLWLNEGFATWMEVLVQDALFPEWQMWSQFTADHYARALSLDSLANTHPIEVPIEDPRELNEIFDAVSYSKGAAIINMLHHFLGADLFRDGIRHYLRTHQFANTQTTDLWKSLGEKANLDVASLMSTWTLKAGYPILEFTHDRIKQRRFYASPIEAENSTDTTTWPIPLQISTDSPKIQLHELMTGSELSLAPEFTKAAWFKPNPRQSGFYRTLYRSELIQQLTPAIQDGIISAQDRYGIISDITATTKAGLTSGTNLLATMGTLRHEVDYIVWAAVGSSLSEVLKLTNDDTWRSRLYGYGRWLVAPNYERLGWNTDPQESYFDSLMRTVVLGQAVEFGLFEATDEALQRFQQIQAGVTAPADLRVPIYRAVARNGGVEAYESLVTMYRREQNPQERLRLLSALCQFNDPSLIGRTLELGMSHEVRSQDSIYVLAWSLNNASGAEISWQFIQDKWPLLVERYGEGGYILDHLPKFIGDAFASTEEANAIESFFQSHSQPGLARPVAQALETIRLRALWHQRDSKAIQVYVDKLKLP